MTSKFDITLRAEVFHESLQKQLAKLFQIIFIILKYVKKMSAVNYKMEFIYVNFVKFLKDKRIVLWRYEYL